jgi:hypothetical protein
MADGVNIDWGLLKQPDYAGDYANAFAQGRQLAAQSISDQGLLKKPSAPPPAPSGGGLAITPMPAVRAGSGGMMDLQPQIANQSDQERQGAAQRAEAITAMLQGLRASTADPQQRLRMAQHVAATAPSLGIPPGKITINDVTDQGIAGHLATVISLQRQIQMQDQRVRTWRSRAQGASTAPVGTRPPPPQAATAVLQTGRRRSTPTNLGGQRQANTRTEGGVRYIGPVD